MTRADQDTPALVPNERPNPDETTPQRAAFGGEDRRDASRRLGHELRRVCLDDAWDRYRQHEFERAEALCRELLSGDGQSVPYRVLLAVCLFRLGRAGEALDEIDELIRRAPHSPDLLELRLLLRAS